MDKLIHTALNSMHSARLKQTTSAQNLSNAQVPGFRGDEIGGRFGSVYLFADNQLETLPFFAIYLVFSYSAHASIMPRRALPPGNWG